MQKLTDLLNQEDTVLFVGSGISRWSGLGSWEGFVNDLSAFVDEHGGDASLVKAELRNGDLLQAASYGFDKLSALQIGEFIRRATKYGDAKPHEIHRLIVSLGPKCFITTNYDNLLEESLRLYAPQWRMRPPVTNRHLTECAEIVGARSVGFIFKPHGDAGDVQSVVLTREQYRQLLPGGEKNIALETLKVLLVTRPVIFLGFGLRDPDFIYVKDILLNTFTGGMRDHYAIMPSVTADEISYWRKHYGIHLINYDVVKDPEGGSNHQALIELLRGLAQKGAEKKLIKATQTAEPSHDLFSLARYAAGISRFVSARDEVPLSVNLVRIKAPNGTSVYDTDIPGRLGIAEYFKSAPPHSLLIGLPGAGKTYALKQRVATCARELAEHCLEDAAAGRPVVPIYVDMKMYAGSIYALAEHSLPSGLSIERLKKYCDINFYIDCFNEMPREQLEAENYRGDVAKFLDQARGSRVVISSRSNDGLDGFGLPAYELNEIGRSYVADRMRSLGILPSGEFAREIVELLQRPFYFNLISSGAIDLPKDFHPRAIYELLLNRLQVNFKDRFGLELHLEVLMRRIAYNAINEGREVQSLGHARSIISAALSEAGSSGVDVDELINWLVSKSFFIAYSGDRFSFFHQSVTEFLAGKEMAQIYKDDFDEIFGKISSRRWDQAIFSAISLMEGEGATRFVDKLIGSDLNFAIRASKYAEYGRSDLVGRLLSHLIENNFEGVRLWDVSYRARDSLVVDESHEHLLRALIVRGGALGGAAVQLLCNLKGGGVKEELMSWLYDFRRDYNFLRNGLADALRSCIELDDVPRLFGVVDSIHREEKGGSETTGVYSSVGHALGRIEVSDVALAFGDVSSAGLGRVATMGEYLWGRKSSEALVFAGQLLLESRFPEEVSFPLHMLLRREEDAVRGAQVFSEAHIRKLIELVAAGDKWAFCSLSSLATKSDIISDQLVAASDNYSGLIQGGLRYIGSGKDFTHVVQCLESLLRLDSAGVESEPLFLLSEFDIDWNRHKDLLARLLAAKHLNMTRFLLEPFRHHTLVDDFDAGDIFFWLDWMLEVSASQDQTVAWWHRVAISDFFSRSLDRNSRGAFVKEFNNARSRYRMLLADDILLARNDLTTDDFSHSAIDYLLNDVKNFPISDGTRGHLLGLTATDEFVNRRLLPLVKGAKGFYLSNLAQILNQAGQRHGKRYLLG